MDFAISYQYRLLLTPAEFRVVSKALRFASGDIYAVALTDDERTQCAVLQNQMQNERAKVTEQLASVAAVHAENANKVSDKPSAER